MFLHHEALEFGRPPAPAGSARRGRVQVGGDKAELLYGVEVSPRRAQDAAALAEFLPYVEALDFTDDATVHYAEIRADLKRRGAMIGADDLFIAAHEERWASPW